MGELEASRFAPVNAPAENVPELEATRLGFAANVPVERLAELTVDRVPPDPKTVLSATRNCRYCGQLLNGRVCDHCGRSSGSVVVAAQPGAVTPKSKEPQPGRCHSCGAPGLVLERCTECGRLIPAPEE